MMRFGMVIDEEEHKEYFDVMKLFEGRDFKKERERMLSQCDSLSNKPQISSFAKKGFYVLE